MKTIVEVSNRHVHLSKEIKAVLFGKRFNLKIKKELSQIGEFSSTSTVTIKTKKAILENVRVVGPLRDYTQVEVSKSDALYLGIKPPKRNSGDLKSTPGITIIGPKGEKFVKNCVIISNRHLHLSLEDARKNKLKNNEIVKAIIKDKEMENIYVKTKDSYTRTLHVDKDDVEKYEIFKKTEAEIVKTNLLANILFLLIEFFFILIFIDFLCVTLYNSFPMFSIKNTQNGNTTYNAFGYRVYDCLEGTYLKSYYNNFNCKRTRAVFELTDKTGETCDDSLLYIYEDSKYKYAFSCVKEVYLDFEDGTELKVEEALYKSKVSIRELEEKGLEIIKEIK